MKEPEGIDNFTKEILQEVAKRRTVNYFHIKQAYMVTGSIDKCISALNVAERLGTSVIDAASAMSTFGAPTIHTIKSRHFKFCWSIGFAYWKDLYAQGLYGYTHNIVLPFCRIQWGKVNRIE